MRYGYVMAIRPDELYHYGIKGMHWGVRRYQNADGSYTSAGRKHYGIGKKIAQTHKKVYKSLVRSNFEYELGKYGVSGKELTKMSNESYDKWKKAAKVGLAVAGVTAVGLTAHYIGKNYIGDVIKAGTTIQTLSHDPNRLETGRSFFTNFNQSDKDMYVSMFGGNDVTGYKHKITADLAKDIKVAPSNVAEKVYKQTIKEVNDEVWKNGGDLVKGTSVSTAKNRYIYAGNKRGLKTEYQGFNYRGIPQGDKTIYGPPTNEQYGDQIIADKFYKNLKEKGYGAVWDENDRRTSVLRGKKPVIVFDTDSVNKSSIKTSQLDKKTVETGRGYQRLKATKNALIDDASKDPAHIIGTSAVIGLMTTGKITGSHDNKAIRQYKKDYRAKKREERKKKKAVN